MIQFACPQCVELISVPDTFAGQDGRCKHCGAAIEVPQAPGRSHAESTLAGSDEPQTLWTQIHEGPPAIRYGAVALAWALVFSLILLNSPGSPVPSAEDKVREHWANWQRQSKTLPHINTSDIVRLDVLDELLFKGQATVWIRTAHADGTYRNHTVILKPDAGRWKADSIHWFDKIQRSSRETAYYPDEGLGGDFEVFHGKQRYAWAALFNDPHPSNREHALREASRRPEVVSAYFSVITNLIDDPNYQVSRQAKGLVGRRQTLSAPMIEELRERLKESTTEKQRAFLLRTILGSEIDDQVRREVSLEALEDDKLRPFLYDHVSSVSFTKSNYFKFFDFGLKLTPKSPYKHRDIVYQMVARMKKAKIRPELIQDFLITKVGKAKPRHESMILVEFRRLGPLKPGHIQKLFPLATSANSTNSSRVAFDLIRRNTTKNSVIFLKLICDYLKAAKSSRIGDSAVAQILSANTRTFPPFSSSQFEVAFKFFPSCRQELRRAILIHSRKGKRSTQDLLFTLTLVSERDAVTNSEVVNIWASQKNVDPLALGVLLKRIFKEKFLFRFFSRQLPVFCPMKHVAPFIRSGLQKRESFDQSLELIQRYDRKAKPLLPELTAIRNSSKDVPTRRRVDFIIRKISR